MTGPATARTPHDRPPVSSSSATAAMPRMTSAAVVGSDTPPKRACGLSLTSRTTPDATVALGQDASRTRLYPPPDGQARTSAVVVDGAADRGGLGRLRAGGGYRTARREHTSA